MKKRILFFAAIFLVLAIFSACTSTEETTLTNDPTDEPPIITQTTELSPEETALEKLRQKIDDYLSKRDYW